MKGASAEMIGAPVKPANLSMSDRTEVSVRGLSTRPEQESGHSLNQRVSVCLATYNGAAFIAEQLLSILEELLPTDEVVIVDDASTDNTVSIIEDFNDSRIRLIRQHENKGYVRTFERALGEADGDVLFLSDQDDVWVPGRRALLVSATAERGVAASNLILLDTGSPMRSPLTGKPWLLRSKDSNRRRRNQFLILIGDIPYYGCAMSIRSDVRDRVLPFPDYLTEGHDLWIATVANRHGLMSHLDQPTVRRRVHESNASPSRPRSPAKIFAARWMLVRAFFSAGQR